MQRQPVHALARLAHQHRRPIRVPAVRAAGDLEDAVAPVVPHIGRVTLVVVRVKVRRHLPAAAPVLVAHAPILHPPRLRAPVLPPQIRHRADAIERHIFHPLRQLLHRAAPHVAADVRLAAQLLAQVQKLVRAEVIILRHPAPMRVHHGGSLARLADAVPPMVLIRETPARPAQHGDLRLLQRLHRVLADAAHVLDLAVRLHPIALVDAPAQMLGEMPVNVPVDRLLPLIGVDDNRVGSGFSGPASDKNEAAQASQQCEEAKSVHVHARNFGAKPPPWQAEIRRPAKPSVAANWDRWGRLRAGCRKSNNTSLASLKAIKSLFHSFYDVQIQTVEHQQMENNQGYRSPEACAPLVLQGLWPVFRG